MVDSIDPFTTPTPNDPNAIGTAEADVATPETDQNRPPETPAEPEEETDEEWARRFVEENAHLAPPPLVRPPAPPPQPWDGPRSQWKVPDHLSMPHPNGGYMAMALLSRTMDDLDEVTGGKRAATYEEVDKYFGHALVAEGLVPFTYTADEAIRWWKAGGYRVLGSSGEKASNSSAAKITNAAFMTGAFAPEETSEAQGTAAVRSSSDMSFNGMMIDDGVDEREGGGDRSAEANGTPTGGSSNSPARPTTLADVIKGVETWGSPKSAPARATPPSPPSPTPAPRPRSARPSASGDSLPGALKRDWPVPGGGRTAQKGERDSRGKQYSDGSYDLTGGKRGGRKHKGYDLPGEIGAVVGAAANGVVVAADTEREKIWERDKAGAIKRDKQGRKLFRRGKKVVGWGNYVIIQHPDGYRTVYAHLREVPQLKKGQTVRMDQEIGRLGITGNAATKGSHVHFEVRDRSMAKTYDPADWLSGRLPALRH